MRRLILLAVLTLSLATSCGYGASQEAWLHGTWVLTHNPQHDSEDDLVFHDDGTVEIHTAAGEVIAGTYSVTGDELTMTVEADRKSVDAHFAISPDRSRLVYNSGAYYTREN